MAGRGYKFTDGFIELRRKDGLIIEKPSDEPESVAPPGTPDEIKGLAPVVTHSAYYVRVNNSERKGGFVFSLNMREHGIETIKIFELNLDKSEVKYLLDGEIVEDQSRLVKRPIMLLSLDYLKSILPELTKNSPMDAKDFEDCKELPKIPVGRRAREGEEYKDCDFVLFDYDVNHREKSIKDAFSKIVTEGRIEAGDFRTLCPVTWKTLETCLQQGLIL